VVFGAVGCWDWSIMMRGGVMCDVGEKTGSDGRYWWVFFQGLIAAAPLFGRDRPLKVFERWQI
jgi:hypothetical protein